jgi:hypothetical protein
MMLAVAVTHDHIRPSGTDFMWAVWKPCICDVLTVWTFGEHVEVVDHTEGVTFRNLNQIDRVLDRRRA